MSERLSNPSFTSDLSDWTNSGQYWENGKSRGDSYSNSSSEKTTSVRQSVAIYGTVLSATISVLAYIKSVYGAYHNGHVKVQAKLQQPDGTVVALADVTHSGNWSGDVQLLSAMDVSAYMTQAGTYVLILEVVAAAAATLGDSGATYSLTYGAFDSAAFNAATLVKKTVAEKMGSGDGPTGKAKLSQAAAAALSEGTGRRISMRVASVLGLAMLPAQVISMAVAEILGLAGSYDTSMSKLRQAAGRAGLKEAVARKVKMSVAEVLAGAGQVTATRLMLSATLAGLAEAWSYVWRPRLSEAQSVGLVEGLVGTRVEGNVTRRIVFTAGVAEWDAVAPVVTRWRKRRVTV